MVYLRAIPIAFSVFTSNLWNIVPEILGSRPLGTQNCLHNSSIATLEQLVDCLVTYTVLRDYYTPATYEAAQPSIEERQAWSETTTSLLVANHNCSSIVLPQAIAGIYSISRYTEHTGASYCVLSEARIQDGVYVKGWGHLIVPDSVGAVRRHLHVSAPHPLADSRTPEQAAAVFKNTGAKSLFIPGRLRTAFLDPTDCITGGSGKTVYYRTDPAHDTVRTFLTSLSALMVKLLQSELFFETNKAISAWQHENGGCASRSCAFIQFHGKSASTCSSDQMFLSSGLGM